MRGCVCAWMRARMPECIMCTMHRHVPRRPGFPRTRVISYHVVLGAPRPSARAANALPLKLLSGPRTACSEFLIVSVEEESFPVQRCFPGGTFSICILIPCVPQAFCPWETMHLARIGILRESDMRTKPCLSFPKQHALSSASTSCACTRDRLCEPAGPGPVRC